MWRFAVVVLLLGAVHGLENVVDLMTSLQNTTEFSSLITKAGLSNTFRGNGPYTILVPVDAAFAALQPTELQQLTGNQTSAAKLVNYHVLHGEIFSYDISSGRIIKSLSGHDVRVYKSRNDIYFNNAKAIKLDIEGANGVVYLIDNVLDVPEGYIYQILSKPEYSLSVFKSFVDKMGFAQGLNSSRASHRYTVFAPSDAAFAKLDQALVARFLRYISYTDALVQYHIHPGTLHLKSLDRNGTISTMHTGHIIGVSVTSNDIRLNDVAHVTVSDIEAENGVVHVIDHVLIPSSLAGTIVG